MEKEIKELFMSIINDCNLETLVDVFEYTESNDFTGIYEIREYIMNIFEKKYNDIYINWMNAYGEMELSQNLRDYAFA